MSSLRAHLNALAVQIRPGMSPNEAAVLQGELIRASLMAGRMEWALDEYVADAMEEATLPPQRAVVIDIAAFRGAR